MLPSLSESVSLSSLFREVLRQAKEVGGSSAAEDIDNITTADMLYLEPDDRLIHVDPSRQIEMSEYATNAENLDSMRAVRKEPPVVESLPPIFLADHGANVDGTGLAEFQIVKIEVNNYIDNIYSPLLQSNANTTKSEDQDSTYPPFSEHSSASGHSFAEIAETGKFPVMSEILPWAQIATNYFGNGSQEAQIGPRASPVETIGRNVPVPGPPKLEAELPEYFVIRLPDVPDSKNYWMFPANSIAGIPVDLYVLYPPNHDPWNPPYAGFPLVSAPSTLPTTTTTTTKAPSNPPSNPGNLTPGLNCPSGNAVRMAAGKPKQISLDSTLSHQTQTKTALLKGFRGAHNHVEPPTHLDSKPDALDDTAQTDAKELNETTESEPIVLDRMAESEPMTLDETAETDPNTLDEPAEPNPYALEETAESQPLILENTVESKPIASSETAEIELNALEEITETEPIVFDEVSETEPKPLGETTEIELIALEEITETEPIVFDEVSETEPKPLGEMAEAQPIALEQTAETDSIILGNTKEIEPIALSEKVISKPIIALNETAQTNLHGVVETAELIANSLDKPTESNPGGLNETAENESTDWEEPKKTESKTLEETTETNPGSLDETGRTEPNVLEEPVRSRPVNPSPAEAPTGEGGANNVASDSIFLGIRSR
eukprot:GHVT01028962.1.p1 GENE.GHVT01028962.1~~GHVT01028962.1.p1  ORF type:complete len:664 (-),score=69.83 GHVT01028962.1:738-2729(-)